MAMLAAVTAMTRRSPINSAAPVRSTRDHTIGTRKKFDRRPAKQRGLVRPTVVDEPPEAEHGLSPTGVRTVLGRIGSESSRRHLPSRQDHEHRRLVLAEQVDDNLRGIASAADHKLATLEPHPDAGAARSVEGLKRAHLFLAR
jgi:hypothetical protein